MRQLGGKTVEIVDPSFKRRRDHLLANGDLIAATHQRIRRRVACELSKVFAFEATRIERNLVACYAADEGGHFRPHRDNTTLGTAHRRFAVSINPNADFEGGEISFPEYGHRRYKVPIGGAIVFPCALLHAVAPITCGRRYAFLPFLYDEAAASLREENSASVVGGASYQAGRSRHVTPHRS